MKPMRKPFRINCTDCVKRFSCTDLCENARKYVDQDQVPLREKVLGRPLLYATWGAFDRYIVDDHVVLNERQLCLMVLVSSGVPTKIIKKGMRLSQASFDSNLKAVRREYSEFAEKNTENE